jgi:hypothetical protein
MGNVLLETALEYCDLGFSVIPIWEGQKKPTKIKEWTPYQTKRADKNQITQWWTKWPNANIGLVTGKVSNLFVADLDRYKKNFDDEIALQFFPDSLVTATSLSPQKGEHLYFSYPDNFDIGGRSHGDISIDFRSEGNYIIAPPSINGNGTAYQWVNSIFDTPLAAVPTQYLLYINKYIYRDVDNSKNNSLQSQQTSTSDYNMFRQGNRDQDIFHIANQLVISRTPEQEIRQVVSILAKNCNPPFPENEIETKIMSALKFGEKRDHTLAQEIKDWLCPQSGTINLQSVYNHLQLTTRQDKKNASIILKRLSEGEDRILDKEPGVVGNYKIINKSLKRINLADTSDLIGDLPIDFPLGIEKFIKPMPGCVYVIAGETDSGKSAYLINFAKKNVDRYKVHYFSTEMGKAEFLDRTTDFWPEAPTHPHFNFYEHYEDFEQVLFPNDINIIDYLELFEDFYRMAGHIKKIGMALKNGIAFIALQKPKGRDEGEGGERTKNLPRLYLSLKPNNIKITKAKNWRNSKINPNKLEQDFKLINGLKFIGSEKWERRDDE